VSTGDKCPDSVLIVLLLVQATSPVMYNTLLELYLHDFVHETDGSVSQII